MNDEAKRIVELTDIITDPTARVSICGQFAEDESTIQNFKQISEGQDLYSKQQLEEAYERGKKEADNQ